MSPLLFFLFRNYLFTTGANISDKSYTNISIKEQKNISVIVIKVIAYYHSNKCVYIGWNFKMRYITQNYMETHLLVLFVGPEQNIEFRTKPIMSFMCWATYQLLLHMVFTSRNWFAMQGPVAIILISWNVIFIWETGYWTRTIKRFALFDLLKSLYSDTKILSKYIPSLQKRL
jgi:hypothetical protein